MAGETNDESLDSAMDKVMAEVASDYVAQHPDLNGTGSTPPAPVAALAPQPAVAAPAPAPVVTPAPQQTLQPAPQAAPVVPQAKTESEQLREAMQYLGKQNELYGQIAQEHLAEKRAQRTAAEQRDQEAAAVAARAAVKVQPTTKEMLKDYRPPARPTGMSDEDFKEHQTEAVMDHLRAKDAAWHRDQAQELADNAVGRYQQQQQRAADQQVKVQRYNTSLDAAVTAAGYAPGSDQANFVRSNVHANITAHMQHEAAAGRPVVWNEQQWHTALKTGADYFKRYIPPAPTPGQAPQLQVVQGGERAPIGAGGSSSVPSHLPSNQQPVATSMDEVIEQMAEDYRRQTAQSG